MKYIYQNPDWHNFMWHGEKIQKLLLDIKKAQGYLLGRMDSLGFDVKNNALLQVLTENIIKSSEIEGQILDKHIVRSSIARRLGIDIGGETPVSRDVEGVIEMMIDATQNYDNKMTKQANDLFANVVESFDINTNEFGELKALKEKADNYCNTLLKRTHIFN